MGRVSIKHVAALAGTSPATVSKVLNNAANSGIPESTAQRVRWAASKLQYVPLATARSLRSRRTGTIGVILHDLSPHAASIVLAIEQAAAERGMFTVLALHKDSSELESQALLMGLRGQVDGLVVLPARHNNNQRLYDLLRRQGVPFVFVDRYVPGYDADYVGVQNEVAAYRLTRLLINQGCRTIRAIFGASGNTAL
ncbi:MAG: LacI family transcriptional regulator, partial [Anaerolineae bacterium]|nr:LacI family transcriptional regulator [Anaerolineae bacterium]